MSSYRDFFGRTEEQWLAHAKEEARRDALALAEIIKQGRDGFQLRDEALSTFVQRNIERLLQEGAQVVAAASSKGIDWQVLTEYRGEPEDVAKQLIARWRELATDNAYFAWISYNGNG
jgi:hypothetical protein